MVAVFPEPLSPDVAIDSNHAFCNLAIDIVHELRNSLSATSNDHVVVVVHKEVVDELNLIASLRQCEDRLDGLSDKEVAREGVPFPAAVGDMDNTAISIASVAEVAWHRGS